MKALKYSSYDATKAKKFSNMMKGNRFNEIVEALKKMKISENRAKDLVIIENFFYFQIPNITLEDCSKEQNQFWVIEEKLDVKIDYVEGDKCVEFIIEVLEKFAKAVGPYYLSEGEYDEWSFGPSEISKEKWD